MRTKNNKEMHNYERAGVVAYSFSPSTWEADVGGYLCVRGQPGLQNVFQASQGYVVRLCLKI